MTSHFSNTLCLELLRSNATSVVYSYCAPYMVINYDVKSFNVTMVSAVTQLLWSRVTAYV